MNKIFITGATGYIGHQLSKKLLEQGNELHLLIRKKNDDPLFQNRSVKLFYGDITDEQSVREAVKGCGQVYHVAAMAKLWSKDPSLFYEVNVRGTANVLREAFNTGVKKIVYTSSTAVSGTAPERITKEEDPRLDSFKSDYDLSKQLAENLINEYVSKGMHCVIVRPSRVYGPGPITYSNFFCREIISALKKKYAIIPYAKNVIANYAFIEDVTDGHIGAMKSGRAGEKYILGGENITYDTLLSYLKQYLKKVVFIPATKPFIMLASYKEVLKSNITSREPELIPAAVKRYFTNAAFSCDKAKNQLGYTITPFKIGMEKTINYLKNLYNEK